MPNCDWNRSCDCRDCRELIETHICPSCGFKNRVSIDRISHWTEDRKGIGGYDFEIPKSPIKDLACFFCGFHMEAVGFYTSIHEQFCQEEKERLNRIRAGRVCSSCNKVEEMDFDFNGRVKLRDHKGRHLCESCLVDTVKQEQIDPSNANNKYIFDGFTLTWVLNRVKIPCSTCDKLYWVKESEQGWRRKCKTCYSRR